MKKPQILWLRNDLRLRDHAALCGAAAHGPVIPVWLVPAQWRGIFSRTGLARMSPRRKQFVLEYLQDLRQSLQERGSDLIVRDGKPEDVLHRLVRETGAEAVHFTHEPAWEEQQLVGRVRELMAGEKVQLHAYDGASLYFPEDLPFSANQTPDTFSKFRGKVEKYGEVQPPLEIPEIEAPAEWPKSDPWPVVLNEEPDKLAGEVPNIFQDGKEKIDPLAEDARGVLRFKGGESAGLQRLMDYCGVDGPLQRYKETRNGLLGADYSSKFSPWLATGCISPRTIYAQIRRYEEQVVKNKSTYWLIFELLWREYFRFWTERYGKSIFLFPGPRNKPYSVHPQQRKRFRDWAKGETGVPFIDANMRELNATGFMSNRGRQVVASFLVKDLAVNWTWGAEYFERMLLDYDVYSNWGNWTYVAGVGADPRQDRYFHTLIQADRYDPQGDYVRHWIPELGAVPDGRVHTFFAQSTDALNAWNIEPGKDFPLPIVVPSSWKKQLPDTYTSISS